MEKDIKNSKILVTGGAGFIGSHLVDALIKRGAKVIVIDNLSIGREKNINPRAEFHKLDIRNFNQISPLFNEVDYVFHKAALRLWECEENPAEAIKTNIMGTFNVCQACVNAGVKKIIAASSASVYGEGVYFPIDENHPLNNYSFYGAAKVANEQLFRAFWRKYGLNYITFRYFNVYGPRMDSRLVVMNFLNKIKKKERPIIFGNGLTTVDLIYINDVVKANILALKSKITNEVFNICTGKETSLKELLEIILKITKSNISPIYQPSDPRLIIKRSCGSFEKAKKMLGFKPKISLEQGLKKVIAWYKEVC